MFWRKQVKPDRNPALTDTRPLSPVYDPLNLPPEARALISAVAEIADDLVPEGIEDKIGWIMWTSTP